MIDNEKITKELQSHLKFISDEAKIQKKGAKSIADEIGTQRTFIQRVLTSPEKGIKFLTVLKISAVLGLRLKIEKIKKNQ